MATTTETNAVIELLLDISRIAALLLDDDAPEAVPVEEALFAAAFSVPEGAAEVLVVEVLTLNAPFVSPLGAVPFWYASSPKRRQTDTAVQPFCLTRG